MPEGKSLDSDAGSATYKRVYKDWKPSVEQKDILGAMEAIEGCIIHQSCVYIIAFERFRIALELDIS